MKDKNLRGQWREDIEQAALVAACLQLCGYRVASPERARFMLEVLSNWTICQVWSVIEEHSELFCWQVSIQGARLTDLGIRLAKLNHHLVHAKLGSSDCTARSGS